jgi:hypothetical protein
MLERLLISAANTLIPSLMHLNTCLPRYKMSSSTPSNTLYNSGRSMFSINICPDCSTTDDHVIFKLNRLTSLNLYDPYPKVSTTSIFIQIPKSEAH